MGSKYKEEDLVNVIIAAEKQTLPNCTVEGTLAEALLDARAEVKTLQTALASKKESLRGARKEMDSLDKHLSIIRLDATIDALKWAARNQGHDVIDTAANYQMRIVDLRKQRKVLCD